MSFLDNIMNKIKPEDDNGYIDDGYDDGFDDGYDERDERKESGKRFGLFNNKSAKVIEGAPQSAQLVTVRPNEKNYTIICDYLLEGRIVVLNMEGLDKYDAQKILDFTYGAVYAIGGNFQKINGLIFVATPMNVDISGEFAKNPITEDSGNMDFMNGSSSKYKEYSGFRYND